MSVDEIYDYLKQKMDECGSLLSNANDKLSELESKSSRISIPLNFHFFLRILFGIRYKKLDKKLEKAEPIYKELVRKQGFMKPMLQFTDPIVKDLLDTKKTFDEWYQDVKNLVDSLDELENKFDDLNSKIQSTIQIMRFV